MGHHCRGSYLLGVIIESCDSMILWIIICDSMIWYDSMIVILWFYELRFFMVKNEAVKFYILPKNCCTDRKVVKKSCTWSIHSSPCHCRGNKSPWRWQKVQFLPNPCVLQPPPEEKKTQLQPWETTLVPIFYKQILLQQSFAWTLIYTAALFILAPSYTVWKCPLMHLYMLL